MTEWGEKFIVSASAAAVHAAAAFDVSPQVQRLISVPQVAQRSQEWFDMRRNCITASDIAGLLPLDDASVYDYAVMFQLDPDLLIRRPSKTGSCNPYASRDDIVKKKCGVGDAFTGNPATAWGSLYEPVAQRLYKQETGKQLLEFGLVIDPENPWLGASPDGVTTDGVMLEIKCPWRREISPVVPLAYWIQMQIQMQACKLELTQFLDCIMVKFVSRDTWLTHDAFPEHHYVAFIDSAMPEPDIRTRSDMVKWLNRNSTLGEPQYCAVASFVVVDVPRCQSWFERNKPRLHEVWRDIVNKRSNRAWLREQKQHQRS